MRKRAYPPVTAGFVVVMAFFGLGISACLRTESGRKAELRERAEELVPADAQILVISYGDCVELAASPSCARVVFEMAERDPAVRAALVRAEAEGQGWTVTHSDDAQGGWSVYAKRDGFAAVVFLWRSEAYDVDCRDRPDPRSEPEKVCFNTLNVERQVCFQTQDGLAEIAAGIALTLSEVVTALVGQVVAKLRGHDLFDEVMGEAEAGAARPL